MDSESETEVPVPFPVQNDVVRIGKDRCVTVGHRPGQPQALALAQLRSADLEVGRNRASVAGCRSEETQEFFGRRIEQALTLAIEQVPLIGIRRQPLERVSGEGRRRIEATPDQQAEHAEQFEIGRRFAVDAQPDEPVDESRARVRLDLGEIRQQVDAHRAMHLGDPLGVRRVLRRVDRCVHRFTAAGDR